MKSSDPNSQLPAWIFIATDLALIGAAALIAFTSPRPLPGSAVTWIVTCLGLGAIVGLVPLIVIYERRKNAQLDERQRELEALSRTVSSSAEQISIAANGLHQIAELALKNLRMAEHLPQKLQERVAEFQAQVAAANDSEKEELERELLSLRTSESERLESTAQRIAKSAAEWGKLEAAVQQHFAAAAATATQLGENLGGAIDRARSTAEQALAQARIDAARGVGEASGQAVRAVEAAKAAALAEFDTKLATAAALVVERITAALHARPAPAAAPVASGSPVPAPVAPAPAHSDEPPVATAAGSAPPPAPLAAAPVDAAAGADRGGDSALPSAAAAAVDAPVSAPATVAPKRPRRPRREEATPAPVSPALAAAPEAPAETKPAAAPLPAEEPPPVPAAAIPEITPVAPNTAEPFSGHLAAAPTAAVVPPSGGPEPVPARPARRRPEQASAAAEPGLGLDLGEGSSGSVAESMLTSDGATRLLITAYIGIGNRLFIRGDGPGLTWEKGVPLQFVSIGKWRWETNEATRPVRFRLYKNDTVECAALGEQTVELAHQLEVTASF